MAIFFLLILWLTNSIYSYSTENEIFEYNNFTNELIDLHINYQIGDSKDSSTTRDIIISILEYIRSNPTQTILLIINYSEDIYN